MNAFSVMSSTLLRRATGSNVVPTTSTPSSTTTTATTAITPPATAKDEVVEEVKVKVSKHSNAPHAVLPEFDLSETHQSFDGISFSNGHNVDSITIDTNNNVNDRKANTDRHSVPIMSVTTTPTATVYESPKARKIVPATVHTTPRSSVPSSPSLSSSEFCSSLPPLPSPTIAPARASMDSYLDRARIIKPSPADTVLATTMVSHPRRRQMHKKSASTSVLLPLPHSHHFQYTSSPLASPTIAPSSHAPNASFGSSSLPHIPSSSTPQGTSDIEAVILGASKQPHSVQTNEDAQEEIVDEASSSEDESGEKMARVIAAAAAFAASTVIAKPEPKPEPPLPVESVPPPETKAPLPLVETASEPKIDFPPIEPPVSAPQTLPEVVASPLAPVSSVTPASASFLSSWGRSKAMMPHIPRPSPLMPFHAARKVVTSVKSVGTGLIPSKEQLESIPVAGRILAHPVMDSTLHYIASKTTHRGIPWVDPRKVIKPEDIQYRKLNKKLVQQVMTLSVLAVQKEELSRAIEDEAGDDAFELYLAAITTLMHALPSTFSSQLIPLRLYPIDNLANIVSFFLLACSRNL